MEGGDKEMEVDVTTQQDDESTQTKSDQVMKDRSEPTWNK
jgi:hypothetical protein